MNNETSAGQDTLQIFASEIQICISSKASRYSCCVFIETAPPAGGPPPHRHDREDEVFMVLDGDFEFYSEGNWLPMKTGETRLALRGNYHGFRNVGSRPGRMLLMTTGGGIDEYFRLVAGLKMPDDFAEIAEISEHYGYHFLAAPADGQ